MVFPKDRALNRRREALRHAPVAFIVGIQFIAKGVTGRRAEQVQPLDYKHQFVSGLAHGRAFPSNPRMIESAASGNALSTGREISQRISGSKHDENGP
jgi:hypothetical protein